MSQQRCGNCEYFYKSGHSSIPGDSGDCGYFIDTGKPIPTAYDIDVGAISVDMGASCPCFKKRQPQ